MPVATRRNEEQDKQENQNHMKFKNRAARVTEDSLYICKISQSQVIKNQVRTTNPKRQKPDGNEDNKSEQEAHDDLVASGGFDYTTS